jgi:subtilisin-like proprotein convertase family protein
VQFSDSFPTRIGDTANVLQAPVTGQFKPEQPLSSFVGGPARGSWTLFVTDTASTDVGTIDGFSLNLTYQYKVKPKKKKKK